MRAHGVDGLGAGGGDVDHVVAELPDQGLDVGGDHRLVLDDQHVGGQLGVDLGLGLGDQLLDLGEVGARGSGRPRRGVKPSSAVSRKAWRDRGAMRISRSRGVVGGRRQSSLRLSSWAPVSHQMAWNT